MANKDRNALLDQKGKDVARTLNDWAMSAGILEAGEGVFFSLRMGRISVVQREENPMATEEFAIRGRKDQGVEFLRPARMTSELIDLLLRKLTLSSREFMQKLLVEKRNNPTRITEFGNANDHLAHFRAVVNGVLNNCTIGRKRKRYRLTAVRRAVQLWEVRKVKK